MNSYPLVILSLFFWGVFAAAFIYDRSRYRNCPLLFLALVSTVPALCSLAGEHQVQMLMACSIIIMLAILAVPFFLIFNGIIMFRREGHSLANLLSFFLGIVIGIGEIATFIIFLMELISGKNDIIDEILIKVAPASILISITVIYGSLSFLMFMFYSLFLMIIPRRRDFDYIIIHGAGLLDGDRVSKLLSDRIDKAIDVYRKDPDLAVMIPSGGQGEDETVSEAEAMAKYMIEHGIPEKDIIREDKSKTTYENLLNSMEIINSREGCKYTALVTSNYHVYRALRYCRKIGLKCTGIGSHVALYYWPSALIREYIAIHAEKKHALYLIAGWLICIIPPVMLMFSK